MSRKGSLNLSVQAIVVVVLAMTLLGLGLGFIRNQFRSIGETTIQVQEQIKQQILDDLRTGDKKLSFPATELKLNSGEKATTAFGIKNTGDTNYYYTIDISFACSGKNVIGLNKTTLDPDTIQNRKANCSNWNVTDVGLDKLLYESETEELNARDTLVVPVQIDGTSATSGTGLYKIVIEEDGTAAYASKTFFITVR